MPDPIPYGRQWVDEDDIAAVAEVLRSDFLTTGPAVPAFESALTEITGARHAVAVSSGTAALHAMYFAAGIGPGDEVITSPLTFAATSNAALYLGATVRFADVDPSTGNIDPAAAAALVTDRTRAIVAVDFAGHPADYAALRSAIGPREIALLADAAHSLGATDGGRTVGTLADASALSFHPVKPITTAEGGAILTNDGQLAGRAARFRTHGITRDPAQMQAADPDAWCYEQHDLGFNYRLTDVQAALGRSQLRHLGPFVARRRAIAARYDAAFAEVEGIQTPDRPHGHGAGLAPLRRSRSRCRPARRLLRPPPRRWPRSPGPLRAGLPASVLPEPRLRAGSLSSIGRPLLPCREPPDLPTAFG